MDFDLTISRYHVILQLQQSRRNGDGDAVFGGMNCHCSEVSIGL